MNPAGIWHLGTRYLRRKKAKTFLLVAAFSLVWLLPTLVALVVDRAEQHLRQRSAQTPLLLGRTGSPLELVFNGLYFTKPDQPTYPLREAQALRDGCQSIPIYARFSAQDDRIVGTSIDYFRFRDLDYSAGRGFIRLGECVVGSRVAERRGLGVDDAVISSPGSMFDLAGVYPLKMRICGVLAPTGTADDDAIFVDLKTAWIVEGLGHGHDEVTTIDDDAKLQPKEATRDTIRLNASVVEYREITPENVASFHFHGDQADFPITAAIVLPESAKAQALVKGDLQGRSDLQIVSPTTEMDELFTTVFRIQSVVTAILTAIGIATLAIGFLVFSLSHRLRREEFQNLANMGADPALMRALVIFEALFVLLASLLIAAVVLWIASLVVPTLVSRFL